MHTPHSDETGRANARLIAAAPEMLAMLKMAKEAYLDENNADLQGILAGDVLTDLIAKAEGKTR